MALWLALAVFLNLSRSLGLVLWFHSVARSATLLSYAHSAAHSAARSVALSFTLTPPLDLWFHPSRVGLRSLHRSLFLWHFGCWALDHWLLDCLAFGRCILDFGFRSLLFGLWLSEPY